MPRITASLAALALWTPFSAAQQANPPLRMPAGTVDYYGYTPWAEVADVSPEHQAGLDALLAGDTLTAWRTFLALWEEDPADYLAMQGLASTCRETGALHHLLELAATKIEGGGANAVYFFHYVLGMASEVRNRTLEDASKLEEGTYRRYAFYQFKNDPRALPISPRPAAAMASAALFARFETAASRQFMRKVLNYDSGDDFFRLNYARSLTEGVYMKGDGRGVLTPPSEDERTTPEEAYRQAMIVLPHRSDIVVAAYIGAVAAADFDSARAIELARWYLEHTDPERVEVPYARDLLKYLESR